MAVTVTLINDHLGQSSPTVMGHEYCVDALCNVTSYTTGGEAVTAANLGLSSITAATITGLEKGLGNTGYVVALEVSATGDYASSSSFQIVATDLDGTNAEAGSDDLGMIRVRVWGLL